MYPKETIYGYKCYTTKIELIIKSVLKKIFPSVYFSIKGDGFDDAIQHILLVKDKIYTSDVIFEGEGNNLSNISILGDAYFLGNKNTLVGSGMSGIELTEPKINTAPKHKP